MSFEESGLTPELVRAVEDMGWMLPTPIQQEAIPLILGGGDVLAAAETGSGKTGAFALPVLQIVHETRSAILHGKDPKTQGSASSAPAAAAAAAPQVTLSTSDRDALFAVAPDGLTCQSRQEKAWAGARATHGCFAGKVYFECWVRDEGLCRVGWATRAASFDLGTDKHSFGFGGTGKKSHAKKFSDYGEPYGLHDVIGCLLDCEAGKISFAKNGRALGDAFDLPANLRGQVLYPAVCLKNAEMGFNFGETAFKQDPPPGFLPLSKCPSLVAAEQQQKARPANQGAPAPKPLAIILEPTRDLAEQTHTNVTMFAKHLAAPALSPVLLVGGADRGQQSKALAAGADIVTGTIGRIMDFVDSGTLPLDSVRFFVLDEADRLLDDGGAADILKLFNRFPKGGAGLARLQTLLFSATLHSPEIQGLIDKICHNPTWCDLKGKEHVPEAVDHVVVHVDPREDRSWLQSDPPTFTDGAHALDLPLAPAAASREALSEAVKRLKQRILHRLIDAHKMEQCMVFCRTNHDCNQLERFLNSLGGGKAFRGKVETGKENPYSCVVLAGQRPPEERRRALEAFKGGDVRLLISTDVGARGLDIAGLPYVVNMTLPDRSEDYVHRIGRVGRADCRGLAVSLVSAVEEKVWYCTKKGYKPWENPTAADDVHMIWYNEPECLKAIEARIGSSIAQMAPDLSLPESIQAKLGSGAKYGEVRGGGGAGGESAARVEALRDKVVELGKLEVAVQQSYFAIKGRFGSKRQKTAT